VTHRRVLVLGGARSGKSAYAEALLAHHPAVDYVATAALDPHDTEWAARIAHHRARRPSGWTTVETDDLVAVLTASASPALIDSVTAWLARSMDDCGIWTGRPDADASLAAALDRTVDAWAAASREVIAVSDEVGSGVVPESASGRRFRDELGLLNQRLAAAADEVWLVTAGLPLRLR
jgi:adenosylcobinamide kinase/adenosylcobinamide-phosphate guanylyltransferase